MRDLAESVADRSAPTIERDEYEEFKREFVAAFEKRHAAKMAGERIASFRDNEHKRDQDDPVYAQARREVMFRHDPEYAAIAEADAQLQVLVEVKQRMGLSAAHDAADRIVRGMVIDDGTAQIRLPTPADALASVDHDPDRDNAAIDQNRVAGKPKLNER